MLSNSNDRTFPQKKKGDDRTYAVTGHIKHILLNAWETCAESKDKIQNVRKLK